MMHGTYNVKFILILVYFSNLFVNYFTPFETQYYPKRYVFILLSSTMCIIYNYTKLNKYNCSVYLRSNFWYNTKQRDPERKST